MSFKDFSQNKENVVTSNADGDIELRSEKSISLYPGSNDPGGTLGGDKLVWIRDGGKLVFEGLIPDNFEVKVTADTVTADRDLILPDQSGTLATLTDITNALAGITVEYSNATPMPTALGGYTAGTTFTNQTMEQMWTGLLYPYQYPAFTSFSISGQATTLEVGDTIAAASVNFIWATSNSSNVTASSLEIEDTTASTVLGSTLDNDGTETIVLPLAIQKTSATGHTWTISGDNTQSGSFNRTFTVNWKWRAYHGTSANTSLNETEIKALTSSSLESNFTGNKTFAANDYKYMAYPTVFGLKTSFVDQGTGFAVAMEPAQTVSVTNANGVAQNYYVHRTTNTIVGAITIGVS